MRLGEGFLDGDLAFGRRHQAPFAGILRHAHDLNQTPESRNLDVGIGVELPRKRRQPCLGVIKVFLRQGFALHDGQYVILCAVLWRFLGLATQQCGA